MEVMVITMATNSNKLKLWMKLVLSAFLIVILIFGATFSYTFYKLSKVKTTVISKTDEDLGIKTQVPVKVPENLTIKPEVLVNKEVPLKKEDSKEIINIAFFGVDRRYANEPSRSDSIMIVSIDFLHKKIKMSSIMRDTYVKINNHGNTKINHAYAYGGAQLAIRTLNENFNLDIRDYVTVDFFNLQKIIDAIGGVNIDVKQNEISLINSYMGEVATLQKKSVSKITKPGPQTLNGIQAVAYSRIRYTAGGDFVRTQRQRTVLRTMLTTIQSLGAREFSSVVSELLPLTETSMNSIDIIKLGTKVFTGGKMTLAEERFPVDGYCKGKVIDSVWYLIADIKETSQQLHKYIYEDINPVPKSPLF
jgi:LCP family protein required for cell wall assembly